MSRLRRNPFNHDAKSGRSIRYHDYQARGSPNRRHNASASSVSCYSFAMMFVLFAVVLVMTLFTSSESAALTDSSRSILATSRTDKPSDSNIPASNREPTTYLRSPPPPAQLPLPSVADTSSLERKTSSQNGSSLRGNLRSAADESADALLTLIKPLNEDSSAGSTYSFVQKEGENSNLDGSSNENGDGQQGGDEAGELTLNDDKTEDADHDRSGTGLQGVPQSGDNKESTPNDSADVDSESAANAEGKETDNNKGHTVGSNSASINGIDESNGTPFASDSDGEDKEDDSKTVYLDRKRDEGPISKDSKDKSATGTSTDLGQSHSATPAAQNNDPVGDAQEGDIDDSGKVTVIQRKSKSEDIVSRDVESTSNLANATSVISSEDIRSVESAASSGENETMTTSDASPIGNELTDESTNVTTPRIDPSEVSVDGAQSEEEEAMSLKEEGRSSSFAEITASDADEVSIDRSLETDANETDAGEGDELNGAGSEGNGAPASDSSEQQVLDDHDAISDPQTANVENATSVDEIMEAKEGEGAASAPASTDGASVEETDPKESFTDTNSHTQEGSSPIAEVGNEISVSSERKVREVGTSATKDNASDGAEYGNDSSTRVEEVPARAEKEPHIPQTDERDNESLADAEHERVIDQARASGSHEQSDDNVSVQKPTEVSGDAVAAERRTLSEGNGAASDDTERQETAASDLPTADESVEGNEGSDVMPATTDVTSEENELNKSSVDSVSSTQEESHPVVEVDNEMDSKAAEDVLSDERKHGNMEELGLPTVSEEEPQIPLAEKKESRENTESDLGVDQGEASGLSPSALENAGERNDAKKHVSDDKPKDTSGEAVTAER
jgi:hypothetical protein